MITRLAYTPRATRSRLNRLKSGLVVSSLSVRVSSIFQAQQKFVVFSRHNKNQTGEDSMKSLKVSIRLLLILCVGLTCHASLASEDPNMTAEDRAKVIKLLNDSHKHTLDLMEGLSEEQLKFKSAPEKWSVLEVAEHIYLAEGLLFGSVEK